MRTSSSATGTSAPSTPPQANSSANSAGCGQYVARWSIWRLCASVTRECRRTLLLQGHRTVSAQVGHELGRLQDGDGESAAAQESPPQARACHPAHHIDGIIETMPHITVPDIRVAPSAGLLMELEDYNCQPVAEAAGHAGPHRLKHPLSRAAWDDEQILRSAARAGSRVPRRRRGHPGAQGRALPSTGSGAARSVR
jgi:hypothetical protein